MDIIRKANALCNILDQKDLLLLENHSLDKKYKYNGMSYKRKNVTLLMLLTNFLVRYPQIGNIIEQYVRKSLTSDEINKRDDHEWTALEICIVQKEPSIKTIKMLLENGADPNLQDFQGYTTYWVACNYFNPFVMQLILEYDGINIKGRCKYQDRDCSYEQRCKTKELSQDIALLNKKN